MMYQGLSFISLHISICLLIGCGPFSSFADLLRLSHTTYTGVEGSKAEVTCTASVRERLKDLKWVSRQTKNLHQRLDESRKSVKLIIPSLRRDDPGTYTCVLVTVSGEEERAEVHIRVSPKNSEGQTCKVNQFKCKKTKDCIFLNYRCDGKDDCGDGSDEECPGNPCANKFICNNSRCVDHAVRCNHVDNCEDSSDEKDCPVHYSVGDKTGTTVNPNKKGPGEDEDHHGSVRSTIYTIIASTTLLVILISIVIILVFRAKMKRLRQRRTVQNLLQMYRVSNDSRMPPMSGEEGFVEHQPFLPQTSQGFHQGPSIIFNVNNGVQYMSRHRFVMDNPPPYSEVQGREGDVSGGGGGQIVENTPPPYSTLDRNGEREDTQQQRPNQDRLNRTVRNQTQNAAIDEGVDENEVDFPMQRGMNERSRNGREAYSGRAVPSAAQGSDPPGPAAPHQSPARTYCGETGDYGGVNMDINSHFLQHLLISHSGRRRSANGCDSESSSHESGASSSSSSGEDSLYNDLGVASGSGVRTSVHDADTLRARDLPGGAIESGMSVSGIACGKIVDSSETDSLEDTNTRESEQLVNNNAPLSIGVTGNNSDSATASPNTEGMNRDGTTHENSCNSPSSSVSQLEQDFSSPANTAPRTISPILQQSETRDGLSEISPLLCPPSSSFQPTSSGASSDNASSALLAEVARMDERNKPKQGHLSVHKGQIVLHTSDGVLAGQSLRPGVENASQGDASSSATLSGEIIVKDGKIMLQIPVGRSRVPEGHIGFPCMENIGQGRKSPTLSSNTQTEDLGTSALPIVAPGHDSSSSHRDDLPATHPSTEVDSTQPSLGRFGGDLNIRNGELVLEPARHSPSSQFLAHLQDAYIQEEREEASLTEEGEGTVGTLLEPVVNDKRTTSSSSAGNRVQGAKCNSDIVLPRGKR